MDKSALSDGSKPELPVQIHRSTWIIVPTVLSHARSSRHSCRLPLLVSARSFGKITVALVVTQVCISEEIAREHFLWSRPQELLPGNPCLVNVKFTADPSCII